jgi:phage shock protein PspC (stress-responsive transcriptional regulator)
MNKVTTINLNGKAYQIEEAGYELLRKYLDQAAKKLEGNPDKDEIMGDFEHAIAEKCGQYLTGGKDVITTSEIEAIIAKMGPVETGTEDAQGATGTSSTSQSTSGGVHTPRRFYRLVEGEWIAGVCNGLGAYFNLDTSLIRILFVILGLLTHGFMILVYIILAVVMPVARTDEEHERARGQAPFVANEFIEQAKQRYAEFQKDHPHMPATPQDPLDKAEWHKWKHEMKQWKHEWKADRHAEKMRTRAERVADRHHDVSGAGFFRFILGLLITALVAIWAIALWSIIFHGLVFGYPILALVAAGAGLAAHPMVVAIVFITALLYVLVLPLKLLMKNARPQRWGQYSFFNDLVQSVFFVFALYLLLYTAEMLFPVVREAWNMVLSSMRSL